MGVRDAASGSTLRGGALACAFLSLAIGADALGCGRDHAILASTSSGGSDAGGATTSASGSTGGSGGEGGTGRGNQGGEPPGPARLTVLDAIVDDDAIRLCFVPYPDGDATAEPWPGTAGLAFGAAKVIDASDGVIPKSTDVLAIAIGGDLALTAGKTCDEVVAEAAMNGGSGGMGGDGGSGGSGAAAGGGGGSPGAPFVAVSLGVLPASAFTAKKSLLLAPSGCLGGRDHEGSNEASICGMGYTKNTPTATLVALALSRRVVPSRLAIQVVQASVATPAIAVDVAASKSGAHRQIAASLPFGAAQPVPPFTGFDANQLAADGEILSSSINGGPLLGSTLLSEALNQGDASAPLDGHAYAFVAIGPSPQFGGGPWWHAFTWTTVRSDP